MEMKTCLPRFQKGKKGKERTAQKQKKKKEKEGNSKNRQLNLMITGPFNNMRTLRLKGLCHVILAFVEIPNMP